MDETSAPGNRATLPEPPIEEKRWVGKAASGLGVVGLILWKFKFVVVFVLTKLKFLLLGLTKASTFFSMLLAMGVYYTAYGWRFAVGFVLSIYVHEMGHVSALRRHGIAASAPLFIPGIGALVRLQQHPPNALVDSQIGLAGPIWGAAAALGCYLVYLQTGLPLFAALARVGAWINVFNLLPVWQLDGGRGFRSMSRVQRGIAAAVILGLFLMTGEGLLLLLLAGAGYQVFRKEQSEESGHWAFVTYLMLLVFLCGLIQVHVPLSARP